MRAGAVTPVRAGDIAAVCTLPPDAYLSMTPWQPALKLALVRHHAGDGAGAVRNGGGADAEGVVHAELLLFGGLRDGGRREHAHGQGCRERDPVRAWKVPFVLKGFLRIPASTGAPPAITRNRHPFPVRRASGRKGSNGPGGRGDWLRILTPAAPAARPARRVAARSRPAAPRCAPARCRAAPRPRGRSCAP